MKRLRWVRWSSTAGGPNQIERRNSVAIPDHRQFRISRKRLLLLTGGIAPIRESLPESYFTITGTVGSRAASAAAVMPPP